MLECAHHREAVTDPLQREYRDDSPLAVGNLRRDCLSTFHLSRIV